MSFIADDQDSLLQDIDYSEVMNQKSNPDQWYQIARLYDLPLEYGRDTIDSNYIAKIVFNFNEILKYQRTNQVTLDEFFLYIGGLIGIFLLV